MSDDEINPDGSLAASAGEPTADARTPYVVGIGASAGGLEALEKLFEAMPADTGMVFVVIQHLSPDFKSLTDTRLALQTLLRLDGHEVTAVGTGPDALAAVAAAVPDVAVVDIGLPGMSGYEVARQVRADHPTGPPGLVALTGYGQPLDRVTAKAAGFDHHLTKPPNPIELNAVLRSAAEARGAGNGAEAT